MPVCTILLFFRKFLKLNIQEIFSYFSVETYFSIRNEAIWMAHSLMLGILESIHTAEYDATQNHVSSEHMSAVSVLNKIPGAHSTLGWHMLDLYLAIFSQHTTDSFDDFLNKPWKNTLLAVPT